MLVQREVVQITDAKLPIKTRIVCDCDESLGSASHIHDEIELLLLTEGAMEFTVENRTISLTPNQIIFIRGLAMHSSRVLLENVSAICLLQFPVDFLCDGQIGSVPYLPNFVHEDTMDCYVFTQSDDETYEMIDILKDTVREFNAKGKAYDLVLKSYLYKLASILYRKGILKIRESLGVFDDYSRQRLTLVTKYVENNYMKPISAKDVASILNINYSYFCRFFKKMTGETFIQYLQYYRILMAKKLLLDKSKSVSEIMTSIGFISSSYFNRLFRLETGYTPTEYRAKLSTDRTVDIS